MTEISTTPDATPALTIATPSEFESVLRTEAPPDGAILNLPLLPSTEGEILRWFRKLVKHGFRRFDMPFVLHDGWQEKELKNLKKNLRRIFREYIQLKANHRDLKVREFEEALSGDGSKEPSLESPEDCPVYSRELKALADFYRPAFRRAELGSYRSRIFIPLYNESLPLLGHLDPEQAKFGNPRRGLPPDWRTKHTYLPWESLMLSPYTFFYDLGKYTILYHSLLIRKVYGDGLLGKIYESFQSGTPLEDEEAKSFLPLLQEEGYLIPKGSDPHGPLKAAQKNFTLHKPHISILYLLVTNNCNLTCAYCNIESEKRKPAGFSFSYMTAEVAREAIELFIRTRNQNTDPTVIFYGGEPLLNWEVMKETLFYLRKREKEGVFGERKLKIQMVSNGTLITPEIAKILKETGVNAGISIDGMRRHHDLSRPKREKCGSWDDSIRGFFLCRKAGMNPGISCTLGEHNMPEIREIAEYFATELEIRGLGFNIQKGLPADHPSVVCPGLATEKIIEAFRVFRQYGIFEDRILRKIKCFIGEAIWYHDCAGYGGQITVSPQGWVGPCHIFTEDGQFLIGDIADPDLDKKIMEGEVLKTWCRRTPVFMKECLACEALGICGGGCALQAHVRGKDLFAMDEEFCLHCKTALRWMFEELGDSLLERKLLTC